MARSLETGSFMFRRAFLLGLAVAVSGAGPGLAQGYADTLLAELRREGYRDIVVSRTLLGRLRVQAARNGRLREIVLNPNTGEILRDLWLVESGDDTGGGKSRGSGRSGGSSDGGSDDGGSGGSGSGGSDDDGGDDDGNDDHGGGGSGGSGSGGGSDDDDNDDDHGGSSGSGGGGGGGGGGDDDRGDDHGGDRSDD